MAAQGGVQLSTQLRRRQVSRLGQLPADAVGAVVAICSCVAGTISPAPHPGWAGTLLASSVRRVLADRRLCVLRWLRSCARRAASLLDLFASGLCQMSRDDMSSAQSCTGN